MSQRRAVRPDINRRRLDCPPDSALVATLAAVHTVHNERVKLLAGLLNTMAGASFAIGVIAPVAAAFYGPSHVSLATIIIGVVLWLALATVLHLAAQRVLGGLREND